MSQVNHCPKKTSGRSATTAGGIGILNALFANKKSTAGRVSLSNTRVFGLESGTLRAIASSARQAGPSLGLAFIGPRRQVLGPVGVSRECGPKGSVGSGR